jgi:hypothetical protein
MVCTVPGVSRETLAASIANESILNVSVLLFSVMTACLAAESKAKVIGD